MNSVLNLQTFNGGITSEDQSVCSTFSTLNGDCFPFSTLSYAICPF